MSSVSAGGEQYDNDELVRELEALAAEEEMTPPLSFPDVPKTKIQRKSGDDQLREPESFAN